MKHLLIFIALLITGHTLLAQNQHFTFNGTIEFERTLNMYNMIKKSINKDNESYMQQAFDAYKKNNTQFKKQKSILTFAKDKSIYTPVVEDTPPANNFFWSASPMTQQPNVVYTDLTTGLSTVQKKAFEEIFLVKDTTRHINWKITDETREILGYSCRRANAIIMDSIYVVAFYTNEIPVSVGPESFTGLPGMILGVALPHDETTWFATKITDLNAPPVITAPTKGKPLNNKGLKARLNDALSDWGSEGKNYVKVLMW
jgi:GLPGLI family protein